MIKIIIASIVFVVAIGATLYFIAKTIADKKKMKNISLPGLEDDLPDIDLELQKEPVFHDVDIDGMDFGEANDIMKSLKE